MKGEKLQIMEEKVQEWSDIYQLHGLRHIGYQGGFPMIEFCKENPSFWMRLKENKLNKIVRQAEMSAGMELGVGINLRKTAFVLVNNETIVICGHEVVIGKIFENLFLQK